MKALNILALQLDPSRLLTDYIKAGLDVARLVKVEEFGEWMLLLGPGMTIRVSKISKGVLRKVINWYRKRVFPAGIRGRSL